MPHASQGQCTALTKLGRTNGPLRSIMTDLRDARQDHSSGGDDLATRSSISSSSASTMSSAMSLSTIEDGASSDTDSEIARDMDLTVVKIERNTESASASPTNLHDPIHNYLISPVPPAEAGSQAIAVPKRGRGRPRKNSISALSSPTFKAKTFVRSKTGCMTCRKRKKKCDERKPECLNCEKNRVVCSGYPPKEEWQPGKKANTRRLTSVSIPASPSYVISGLESEIDRQFFRHYCDVVSKIITINGGEPHSNPFLSLIVPLARENPIVMHALLGVAGAHISRCEPRDEYRQCQEHHRGTAISMLTSAVRSAERSNADLADPIVACMVLQYQLQEIVGEISGEYRSHCEAARNYFRYRLHEPMHRFANEFFKYADMSIWMTSTSKFRNRYPQNFNSPPELKFAVPGVINNFDGIMWKALGGLFQHITRITAIRDLVRSRRSAGLDPAVDYRSMQNIIEANGDLSGWKSDQEENSRDWLLAELYREAVLVYAHRTIRTSRPDEELKFRVRRGIILLETLETTGTHTNCVVLLPTFIFGCAAFDVEEREDIEKTLDKIAAKNDFGNVELSRKIVQRVWEMMDQGDDRSWDWETIKESMNYDFPVT